MFAYKATHNHFVLDRGGKVFNRTAPVIKLPPEATEEDHLGLLGLLNSSTAAFWERQVHRGVSGAGQEPWQVRLERNATKLEEFPLPKGPPLDLSRRLDELGGDLAATSPGSLLSQFGAEVTPSESLEGVLNAARDKWKAIRGTMIFLQEELDWECYRLYGLTDEALTHAAPSSSIRSIRALSRDRKGAELEAEDVRGRGRFLTGAARSAGHSAAHSAGHGAGHSAGHSAAHGAGHSAGHSAGYGAGRQRSSAQTEPQTYFCTWTCYGTWLHGDARGSIDRHHNELGTPSLEPDEERQRREFALLKHAPVKLESEQRSAVHEAIEGVCHHRGWRLHAVNVRSNHVHAVVTADRSGKRVLNDFKSYATRQLKELDLLPEACRVEGEFRVWTRAGSVRILDSEHSVQRAVAYTLEEQGGLSQALSRDREGAELEAEAEDVRGGGRFLTGAAQGAGYSAAPVAFSGIGFGQRAFEIVMARRMAAGELQTTWFERHRSTPLTGIPAEWPDDYKRLVQRRIEAIENDRNIGLIEQPEYKRRWNTEPWESQLERALRHWLLDRLESYFDFDGRMNDEGTPTAQFDVAITSTAKLADVAARDQQFMEVGALYRDDPAFDVHRLVEELVREEAVPHLPVLRYKPAGLRKRKEWEKTWALQRREDAGEEVGDIPVPPKYKSSDFRKSTYWRLRGKLDVPKERWVGFPHCEDDALPIAWAGYDHLQLALALGQYFQHIKDEVGGAGDKRLVPLLASIRELLPWLKQWHGEVHPEFNMRMDEYFEGFVNDEARQLDMTIEEIDAWEPPKKSGRKRKRKART